MKSLDRIALAVTIISSIIATFELDRRIDALELANQRVPQFTQVLVGQGCEGSSSIAVAVEEDLLPRCRQIDVHEVALGE